MKRLIFLILTLAIVFAFGFQEQPAYAQTSCRVLSTQPCILKMDKIDSPYNLTINPQQDLLVLYTNDSFVSQVTVQLEVQDQAQDTIELSPNMTMWKSYKFQNLKDAPVTIKFIQSATRGDDIETVIVALQADQRG
ncbi:hypothetical protein [Gloeothece verrucosa]|uniref:Uncharacterized protein n=1 Tax=Gloeothece verrucosa (strain PCC 7822) TaxID=497965 RepID=E0U9G3_GLOV7|nr:hypothetical protein [Gloeothece verrucosa]ADN12655.1 hypothetical protein Cyan7822_0619 [Gloeothece verrucosa PCC 7822]